MPSRGNSKCKCKESNLAAAVYEKGSIVGDEGRAVTGQ